MSDQSTEELSIVSYWLFETQRRCAILKEYAQCESLDALTLLDISNSIECMEVDSSNTIQDLKIAYGKLGIGFIPCCDCGRNGGVLKQLWDARYQHINKDYCKPQPPRTHSLHTRVKRLSNKEIAKAMQASIDAAEGGDTTNG